MAVEAACELPPDELAEPGEALLVAPAQECEGPPNPPTASLDAPAASESVDALPAWALPAVPPQVPSEDIPRRRSKEVTFVPDEVSAVDGLHLFLRETRDGFLHCDRSTILGAETCRRSADLPDLPAVEGLVDVRVVCLWPLAGEFEAEAVDALREKGLLIEGSQWCRQGATIQEVVAVMADVISAKAPSWSVLPKGCFAGAQEAIFWRRFEKDSQQDEVNVKFDEVNCPVVASAINRSEPEELEASVSKLREELMEIRGMRRKVRSELLIARSEGDALLRFRPFKRGSTPPSMHACSVRSTPDRRATPVFRREVKSQSSSRAPSKEISKRILGAPLRPRSRALESRGSSPEALTRPVSRDSVRTASPCQSRDGSQETRRLQVMAKSNPSRDCSRERLRQGSPTASPKVLARPIVSPKPVVRKPLTHGTRPEWGRADPARDAVGRSPPRVRESGAGLSVGVAAARDAPSRAPQRGNEVTVVPGVPRATADQAMKRTARRCSQQPSRLT